MVVSADALNESAAGVVMVVPCTTSRRDLPSHVEIDPGDSGMEVVSYAKCEDTKSVSERQLIARLGQVGPDVTFQIGRVLRFILEL